MNTLKRLSAYDTALKKWANKKRVHDLMADSGKPERKPLEPEPLPSGNAIFLISKAVATDGILMSGRKVKSPAYRHRSSSKTT